MNTLFQHTKIKNMELRNRFVRSATYDGCAEKTGHVSQKQIGIFVDLAKGGVGLIVTGITYVHPSGQISPYQNSIVSDDYIPSLKNLTWAVHNWGGKIALQLFHAGRESAGFLRSKNKEAVGPSCVADDRYFSGQYQALQEEQIWETINAFGDAARRAREAEFDAVQIHAAHGYLLSQFLSPYTNHRSDKWGGPLENRLRFHSEILTDIRAKVGEDYPILIKLGVQDGFSGGLQLREGRLAAQYLDRLGGDALEISQGLRGKKYGETEFRSKINRIDREAYFRQWCKEIRCRVRMPIMMVGGLRTYQLMETIIKNNEADFISLSRPLIREPDLINLWKTGSQRRSTCISCNRCLEALMKGGKLKCIQQEIGTGSQD